MIVCIQHSSFVEKNFMALCFSFSDSVHIPHRVPTENELNNFFINLSYLRELEIPPLDCSLFTHNTEILILLVSQSSSSKKSVQRIVFLFFGQSLHVAQSPVLAYFLLAYFVYEF